MNKLIGGRIRELRESAGISQNELADKTGMSRQRLLRMEDGRADISYADICSIAAFLKVNPNEITRVTEVQKLNCVFHRDKSDSPKAEKAIKEIGDILFMFYAHKHIGERMQRGSR